MCGIIASSDKTKLIGLINDNQNRGTFSNSLTVIEISPFKLVKIIKNFGKFDFSILDEFTGSNKYYIVHLQSPTNSQVKDPARIHPSQINDSYLYHNGIIQNKTLSQIKAEHNIDDAWDTKLLHYRIYGNMRGVDNINGSFACIYVDTSGICIFRNNMGILYYDDDLTLSSVIFDGSLELPSAVVWKLDIATRSISELYKFKCEDNYFYG